MKRPLIGACLFLFACSANGTKPAQSVQDQQIAAFKPQYEKLKTDAFTGYDVNGSTLLVSVDADRWSAQDEDEEKALRAKVLRAWTNEWRSFHHGSHENVRVLYRTYYGQEITNDSRRL